MPDFSRWLSHSDPVDPASRAVDAWNRINRNPTTISISRQVDPPPDQVVRIEHDNTSSSSRAKVESVLTTRALTIFGVIGHPDINVPDTDLQANDTFDPGTGVTYRIVDVISPPGEVQARAEAIQ